MKVIRYSFYGFKPQFQSVHFQERVMNHLGNFNINDYPEHLQYYIQKAHENYVKLYSENYKDFKCGIWCFKDGYKDNLSLNHLKQKVPCWEAELPGNTICYDCNWEYKTVISDPSVLYGGFYIPERELGKLYNIHKRRKTK